MDQRPIRVQVQGHGIVEFPAGTSEAEMREALASLSAPPPVAPKADPDGVVRKAPIAARGTQLDVQGVVDSMHNTAPMVGAIVGSRAGIAGAAVGAAAGQAFKDSQWDMPMSDRVTHAVESAAGAAIGEGIGKMIKPAANWAGRNLTSVGRSLWLKMAKVPESIADSTQSAKALGSIGAPAGRAEIAETVLSQGKGHITATNLQALKSTLDGLDKELSDRIAQSSKTIRRQSLIDPFEKKIAEIGNPTSEAAEKTLQALKDAVRRLKQQPPMIPVQRAQQAKREIYDYWTYAQRANEPVKATVDKQVGRQLKDAIVREEPIAGPINSQMSRQIPAVGAMEKAVGRAQNADPVKAAQMIAAAVTNPATVIGGVITIPGIGSLTAQTVYNIGKSLPAHARNPVNVVRMIKGLLSMGHLEEGQ